MMRALVFDQPDPERDTLSVADVAEPMAGTGEVVVAVSHAGLNYADLMMRQGIYPHPKGYPLVAGLEMAGTVEAVGPEVSDFAVGDRVAAFSEDAGAFAERCVAPVERLVQLPNDVSFEIGAAFYIQAMTAWNLLHTVSTTKPGDVLLIHAIGGGVGLYLTQLAKAAGAVVIGTVGTPGKEVKALEFGADLVIDRSRQDFVAAVLEKTGGRGVDKVLDSTGASILDRSFETIRRLGHVVSYGEAEGKPFPNLWEQLVRRSLTFTRMHLGHLDYRSASWRQGVEDVIDGVRARTIKVPIEGVFGFDEASEMFDRLASRQTAGKLILRI